MSPKRALLFVSGGRGEGKTTTLARCAAWLGRRGLRVGGVLQPSLWRGVRRVGYDLLPIGDGFCPVGEVERALGESRSPLRRVLTRGPFGDGERPTFDQQAFEWASRALLQGRERADVLLVDELGWLEARGEGHMKALTCGLEREACRVWLAAVRAGTAEAQQAQLQGAARRLKLPMRLESVLHALKAALPVALAPD